MEAGHGQQAQARPEPVATGFAQADKALHHPCAIGLGMPGRCRQRSTNTIALGERAHDLGWARWRHPLCSSTYLMDYRQVGQRLADEFTVAFKSGAGASASTFRTILFLRERLVEFADIVSDFGSIDSLMLSRAWPDSARAIMGSALVQINPSDSSIVCSSAARYSGSFLAERSALCSIAQTRQRRLEIVRNVIGDLLQTAHQGFDTFQHDGEFSPRRSVIACACNRQSAAKVAMHNGAGGFGHGIDTPQHTASDKQTTDESKNDHDSD